MFFSRTSDPVDEMKGKGRNKRKQRRILGLLAAISVLARPLFEVFAGL